MKLENVKIGQRVRVPSSVMPDRVYQIEDAILTARGLRLILRCVSEVVDGTRDERAVDCVEESVSG